MAAPRQMTAHTLDPKKGWPRPNAVDYVAKFNSTDLGTLGTVYSGRVVHVHTDGTYKYGADGQEMPLFLFQNSDDPDVSNDGGITGSESDEAGGWIAVAPTGKIMALVAIGAYELETTEFTGTFSAFTIGDLLKSATGTGGTAGKVARGAVAYTDNVVGVVSRAPATNSHGKQAVTFWPVYLPADPS